MSPAIRTSTFGWDEYLLYNRQRGFIFLVDSEEGWSVVKPTTGAPALSPGEQSASYLGTRYELKYSYEAETSYVAGEFYWPVERGQKTFNRDFASGADLLSMERTPREVTWSSGSNIASDAVAKAFKLEQKKELLKRSDAGPTSGRGGHRLRHDHHAVRDHPDPAAGDQGLHGRPARHRFELLAGRGGPQRRRLVRRIFKWRRPQVAAGIGKFFSGERHGH